MTYADQIGPVPGWIKRLQAPGYTNVFSLCDPPTIYGTEHMFGDWSGELLILAKDFAPANEVRKLVESRLPADLVYRHNDGDGRYHTGLKTNRRLAKILFGDSELVNGVNAEACGIIYGSASFLLKESETSDSLLNWRSGAPGFEASKAVFEHTVKKMTSLRSVVCLGMEALKLVSVSFGFECPVSVRDAIGLKLPGAVPTFVAPHPSRGSNEIHALAWEEIRRQARLDCIAGSKFS